jgi:hypothetical protein
MKTKKSNLYSFFVLIGGGVVHKEVYRREAKCPSRTREYKVVRCMFENFSGAEVPIVGYGYEIVK